MSTELTLVSVLLLGLGIITLLMPWYTRPDLFFGVTVKPEVRTAPAAQRLVRAYRLAVCVWLVVALAILVIWHRPRVALLAQVVGTSALMVAAHRAATKFRAPRTAAIEVNLSAAPERMPGGGWVAWIPLLWLVAVGAWGALNIQRLPRHILLHQGVDGATRWAATTPNAVLVLFGVPLAICLLLAATAFGILHRARRIATTGPTAQGERQFRRLMVLNLLSVEFLLGLPPILILFGAPPVMLQVWLVVLWSTLIIFIVCLVRAGQGGSRLTAAGSGPSAPVGDHTDDDRWLGGMIYANRADPALFVEKRMGIGWGLNFGNVWAWVLLTSVLAIPLVLHAVLVRQSPDNSQARSEAQTAARAWLSALDAGNYAASWDTAAAPFKNAVPESQWEARIAALRGRLGTVDSRQFASSRYWTSLPGAPEGEYVVIKYQTNFAHEPAATETVTPMKDADGRWRVSGYYIK